MRKLLSVIVIAVLAASTSFAQSGTNESAPSIPRSMGFRVGATGFDATYQHIFKKNQFLQGDLGVDFGYNANGRPGMHATAVYNFIWARPAWTNRGFWALYAGPGLSLGYVNDMVSYRVGNEVKYTLDYGFMLGLAVQVGLEYTFEFPLSLALEVRPVFGLHINDGVEIAGQQYAGKVGFYDNGLLGFVPTLGVRYKF